METTSELNKLQIALQEIDKEYYQRLRNNIKVYPKQSNYPSDLGDPCELKLVLSRTRWMDKELHSPELQEIFDLGKEYEEIIINKLKYQGYEIAQSQRPFYDKETKISGKLDVKIKHEKLGDKWFICELKSMAENTWNKINSYEDLKNHKSPYVRGYIAQVQLYLYLGSFDRQEFEMMGLLILCNKTNKKFKQIMIPTDLDFIGELLHKAERINKYVDTETRPKPEYIDGHCEKCGFKLICGVGFASEGSYFVSDEELSELLLRRDYLKSKYDEYEEIDEQVKDKLKIYSQIENKKNLVIDDFEINVSERNVKEYTVKARTDTIVKIKNLRTLKEKAA